MANIVRSVKSANMMNQIKSVGAECQAQAQRTVSTSVHPPSLTSASPSVTTPLFGETRDDDIKLPAPVDQKPKSVVVSEIFPQIVTSPPKITTIVLDPELDAPRTDAGTISKKRVEQSSASSSSDEPSKRKATIVDLIKRLEEQSNEESKMMKFVNYVYALIKEIDIYVGDIAADMNVHPDFADIYRMSLVFRIWELSFHLDYVKKVYQYREDLAISSNGQITPESRSKREILLEKYTNKNYKKFLIDLMKKIFAEDSVVMMDIFEKYYPERSFYDSIYYINIKKIIAYIQKHQ